MAIKQSTRTLMVLAGIAGIGYVAFRASKGEPLLPSLSAGGGALPYSDQGTGTQASNGTGLFAPDTGAAIGSSPP